MISLPKIDWRNGLAAFLPPGNWDLPGNPNDAQRDSMIGRVLNWATFSFDRITNRSVDLLNQATNPNTASDLLPEWERLAGLAVNPDLEIKTRRANVINALTLATPGLFSEADYRAAFAGFGWVLDYMIPVGFGDLRVGGRVGDFVGQGKMQSCLVFAFRLQNLNRGAFEDLQKFIEANSAANIRLFWPWQCHGKLLKKFCLWGDVYSSESEAEMQDDLRNAITQRSRKARIAASGSVSFTNVGSKLIALRGEAFEHLPLNNQTSSNNSWRILLPDGNPVLLDAGQSVTLNCSACYKGLSGNLAPQTRLILPRTFARLLDPTRRNCHYDGG